MLKLLCGRGWRCFCLQKSPLCGASLHGGRRQGYAQRSGALRAKSWPHGSRPRQAGRTLASCRQPVECSRSSTCTGARCEGPEAVGHRAGPSGRAAVSWGAGGEKDEGGFRQPLGKWARRQGGHFGCRSWRQKKEAGRQPRSHCAAQPRPTASQHRCQEGGLRRIEEGSAVLGPGTGSVVWSPRHEPFG